MMTDILEISCDEAGHTGPDLPQTDQRMFAFSSVAISDAVQLAHRELFPKSAKSESQNDAAN